jgi:hypothetical protein
MFTDMFNALDAGTDPLETFYDGYVVNAIMDACYRSAASRQWEPVLLDVWRGQEGAVEAGEQIPYDKQYWLIKEEKMPDGSVKLILKDRESGEIVQQVRG